MAFSASSDEDYAGIWGAMFGIIPGYIIGTGLGIWKTGQWIEKENGSWLWAVLGSVMGGLLGASSYYVLGEKSALATALFIVGPTIGGLTAYRFTLDKHFSLGLH